MKLVFMGTPEFAIPSLEMLAGRSFRIGAVFCQPDRPRGRSRKPVACPIKECALDLGLPVYQPKRIRAKKWVRMIRELEPDLIVVAAFGQILPRSILEIPPLGCVNVHASLLPRWRGASPIHFALYAGDRETGVAIMKMVEKLDAGPVYSQDRLAIDPGTGRRDLARILAKRGARLLLDTLPRLGHITPLPQDESRVTYAPIIRKEMGYCRFQQQSAAQIVRMVAAFEEWPGAICHFRGLALKLLRVAEGGRQTPATAGEITSVTKKSMAVACAEESELQLLELQPAGKKPQAIVAFINGYHPRPGEILEAPHGEKPSGI